MTHTDTLLILPTTIQEGENYFVQGTTTSEIVTIPALGTLTLQSSNPDGSVNYYNYYEVPHTLGEVPTGVYAMGNVTLNGELLTRATTILNVDQLESTYAEYHPATSFRDVTFTWANTTLTSLSAQLWREG